MYKITFTCIQEFYPWYKNLIWLLETLVLGASWKRSMGEKRYICNTSNNKKKKYSFLNYFSDEGFTNNMQNFKNS